MSEELVDVVDDQDRVIATVTRSRVRAQHLLHRVASVLVFRPDGRLLVHRRTDTKDVFPGAFDCFVSGVVNAGEEYGQARDRELQEEMAIEGAAGGRTLPPSIRGHRRSIVERGLHDHLGRPRRATCR